MGLRWGERFLYWLVIAGLLLAFVWHRRTTLPVAIFVNGVPVAWLSHPSLAEQAIQLAREELRRRYGSQAEFAESVETGRLPLPPNLSVTSPAEAAQQLLRRVTPAQQGWLIVVNDQPVVALPSKQEAEQTLALVKAQLIPEKITLVRPPRFKEKVVVRKGKMVADKFFTNAEEAAQHLLSGSVPPQFHLVQPGEFAIRIARRYQLSLEELQRLNPGKDLNRLRAGDKLLVRQGSPLVTVVCVYQKVQKEPIPFQTERRFAPHLPGGALVTKQRGQRGVKEVVLEVTCENGIVVGQKVVQERVIKEPVPEVILVGGGLR